MTIVVSFSFIVFSLILIGLFLISSPNHKAKTQSSQYWSLAVGADGIGLLLMSFTLLTQTSLSQPLLMKTAANTMLFASLVCKTASISALRVEITSTQKKIMLAAVVMFAIIFDFSQHISTMTERLIGFAVLASLLFSWQLVGIKQIERLENNSKFLRVTFWSIFGELSLTLARFIAAALISFEITQPDQVPAMVVLIILLQYGMKIVSYCALVGYWSETLAIEKTTAEMEAAQFKVLNERQEALIADLGKLNKVATAGVLAASIAHELSQPLQATLLNNEFARQEIETQPLQLNTLRTVLAEQTDSINRMVDTINTMRGVFTATESKPKTVDLFDVVDRLKPLLIPQAQKNNIEIEYLRSGVATVTIKVSEIQQALLNLATNAIQALTTQGTANPRIRIHVATTEAWVTCQIEDNGTGIPAHKQNDLFKFLAKSNTSGMGLGLWLTKYIVERNAGTINAGVSDLGGAMFTIELPRHPSPDLMHA